MTTEITISPDEIKTILTNYLISKNYKNPVISFITGTTCVGYGMSEREEVVFKGARFTTDSSIL